MTPTEMRLEWQRLSRRLPGTAARISETIEKALSDSETPVDLALSALDRLTPMFSKVERDDIIAPIRSAIERRGGNKKRRRK